MGKKINEYFSQLKEHITNHGQSHEPEDAFAKNYTTVLLGKIKECRNDDEYFRLLDPERGGYDNSLDKKWRIEYINNLKGRFIISEDKLSRLCRVSLNKAKSWSFHAPKKREDYVAISCVFGLGVDMCSRIMKRFGGYYALSENKPEDIVFIRLLQLSERPAEEFDNASKQKIYFDLIFKYEDIKKKLDTNNREEITRAAKELSMLNDDKFLKMYQKSQKATEISAEKLNDRIADCFSKIGYSKDSFFKERRLHAIYPKAMSKLSMQNIIPKRNLLISLFLHMGLTMDTINELLDIAEMEPLCSQNPYESALIYVLSSLYKKSPEFGNSKIMLSYQNSKMQEKLREGSLYMYVYMRLKQPEFTKKFEDNEIDLNKCICRYLSEGDDE